MEQQQSANEDDYSIYVWKKEVMDYIRALLTQSKKHDFILIKARGDAISKALEVSKVAVEHFLHGWHIKNTITDKEMRPDRFGDGEKEVSTIRIELVKEDVTR